MKDPAFLFYSKDFYEGTRTMLPEERACFVDLLIYQHQQGPIPNDLERLSMYCSGVAKATLKATLEAKFKLTPKGWVNGRLGEVIEGRQNHAEKMKDSGKLGQFFKQAKKDLSAKDFKALRSFIYEDYGRDQLIKDLRGPQATLQGTLKALLKHLANGDANANANNTKDKDIGVKGKKEKETKADPSMIYPWEDPQFLEAWQYWKEYKAEEHKFQYKSPKSEQAALTELSNKADGDMEKAIAIIRQSVSNGWKGFFELKDPPKSKAERTGKDVFMDRLKHPRTVLDT